MTAVLIMRQRLCRFIIATLTVMNHGDADGGDDDSNGGQSCAASCPHCGRKRWSSNGQLESHIPESVRKDTAGSKWPGGFKKTEPLLVIVAQPLTTNEQLLTRVVHHFRP